MTQQYAPPTAPEHGWQSIPSPIRFAVWVWAVFVIAGAIGVAIGAVIWFIVLASALGQM
jgi:hypothetical protein